MENENIFKLNKISFENLKLLSERQSKASMLRECELAFVADEVLKTVISLKNDGMTVYESLTLLSEENALSELSDEDKITLCELLVVKSKDTDVAIEENEYLPEEAPEEIITYVRNSLSDEAYDVFSENFEDPRVFYSDTFREACFALADGKVGYCILPFEEKGGATIPGISSLVSSLDLKIVGVTPVFGFEGTADMKYALLSRSFVIPERSKDTDRYLELRITRDTELGIPKLLYSADKLGVSIYKINTMTQYESGETSLLYSVILRDGGNSFASLLTYMALFAGGSYTPSGIYKDIE